MIWLKNWWVGFKQQSLTQFYMEFSCDKYDKLFSGLWSIYFLLDKTHISNFSWALSLHQTRIILNLVSSFTCAVYCISDYQVCWVHTSSLLRLYVSRSILLLILQHHRPTLVIDIQFRSGEACSYIGALLFLIAEQVASGTGTRRSMNKM